MKIDVQPNTTLASVTVGQEWCELQVHPDVKVRIESEILVQPNIRVVSPENPIDIAETICVLIGDGIDFLEIRDDSTLAILFSNGNSLEIPPSRDYEAWAVTDKFKNMYIVCLPGGGTESW